MALLFTLHELGYRKLIVCHLNHRLRGAAADADSLLTGRAARELRYPFELGEADVRAYASQAKLSLETGARDLRYAFFRACARDHRCNRLFLAHHGDDQIETCLFNFLRGSGAAGLGGMKPLIHAHGLEILRPMLGVTRKEIAAFVSEKSIPFREDRSNADVAHTRNRLRHRVIPEIERAFGSSFRAAILRAAEILREEESWMVSLLPEVGDTLSCPTLRRMPPRGATPRGPPVVATSKRPGTRIRGNEPCAFSPRCEKRALESQSPRQLACPSARRSPLPRKTNQMNPPPNLTCGTRLLPGAVQTVQALSAALARDRRSAQDNPPPSARPRRAAQRNGGLEHPATRESIFSRSLRQDQSARFASRDSRFENRAPHRHQCRRSIANRHCYWRSRRRSASA